MESISINISSIASNPRLNFSYFIRSVNDAAVNLSMPGQFDLTRCLNTNVNEDGQPDLPEFPELPGNNATQVQMGIYKLRLEKAQAADKAMKRLKEAVITALGDNAERFADPITGFQAITLGALLKSITETYGTLTSSDIAAIQTRIASFPTNQSFESKIGSMRQDFQLLNRCGYFTTEALRVQALAECIRVRSELNQLSMAYFHDVPNPCDQTFSDLVSYIEIRIPTVTSIGAGYFANSVSNTSSINSVATHLPGNHANPNQNSNNSNRGRGRGRNRGRGERISIPNDKPYCFLHGWHNHKGSECRVMANDSSYTEAMKNANAPSFIDGYMGSTNQSTK